MVNAKDVIENLRTEVNSLKAEVDFLRSLNDAFEVRIRKVNEEKKILETGRDILTSEKETLIDKVLKLDEKIFFLKKLIDEKNRYLKIVILTLFAFIVIIGVGISFMINSNYTVIPIEANPIHSSVGVNGTEEFIWTRPPCHPDPERTPYTSVLVESNVDDTYAKSTVILSKPVLKAKKKPLKPAKPAEVVKKQSFSSFSSFIGQKTTFLPVFPPFSPEIFVLSFDSDTENVSDSVDGGVPP